jgi:calcineurin-like phosphoesterase family protein
MSDRYVVIGDVHGDAFRLEALLAHLDFESQCLIFLGDYIDRGPDSRCVLDLLCDLSDQLGARSVFLAGNHELALLRYLADGDLPRFAAYGGIATIRSYGVRSPVGDVAATLRTAIPARHIHFLESLRASFEANGILFSHTGLDPSLPGDRSMATMADTSHPEIFRDTVPQIVVCGHYVQRSGAPLVRDQVTCIDTGCGTINGPLTALVLPEKTFIQA